MTRPLNAYQQAAAKAMTEAELEANVADLCKTLRTKRYHTHRSQHSPAGFPDDVIAGPGGTLFRELKRMGKNPTPEQQEWLDVLGANGHDVGVWRPDDWFSGRIEAEVRGVLG